MSNGIGVLFSGLHHGCDSDRFRGGASGQALSPVVMGQY